MEFQILTTFQWNGKITLDSFKIEAQSKMFIAHIQNVIPGPSALQ